MRSIVLSILLTGVVHASDIEARVKNGYADSNGVKIRYTIEGKGEPVLLIHGWPDSGYLWRHQVPFLAGHGFRVIVPDMRGLGRSDRPPEVADYALAKVIGDVAAVLDAAGVEAATHDVRVRQVGNGAHRLGLDARLRVR